MTLYPNTFFQIISFLYIVLVGVIFMAKKKIKSAENSIFFKLVIIGILTCFFDVSSIIAAFVIPDTLVQDILCKIYLLTLIYYSLIYTEYAIVIINGKATNEEKFEKYKKTDKFIIIAMVIIAIIIAIIPINVLTSGNSVMYSYGPAVYFTYIVVLIQMILWISLIVVSIKKVEFRKILPLIVVCVFGLISASIQFFNPQILLVTSALVYSVVIMYFTVFTIENPDLEMVEEIKIARNEAIKASQAKTDFLSNMSHELRTPLNVILGFSQGLLEQKLPSEAKEDIEDIISASDTLLELVNEILDISKIESDKFEIVETDYSISKVYKYLVTMTEGRIGSRPLEFIHTYDEQFPPYLYGDSVRFKQVIVNFLTNSVKYTKDGYVKLTLSYEPIDDDNCYVVASVSDSGVGMKEEDLKKLFGKFERFDLQNNVEIEGTGLGLALTKRLVDLMGGEIKVESKYGVGSTFTVKIKQGIVHKTKDEIEGENEMVNKKTFEGHGQKVLVVDDNGVNLKVASRLLKPYNLELELINSGKECLSRIAAGNKYDLVLLDDQMPEMTGVETMQHLKNIPNYKTPTIALTANAISGMKEKYIADGFDGYLSKPIDKILLEEALNEFLGSKEENSSQDSPMVQTEQPQTSPAVEQTVVPPQAPEQNVITTIPAQQPLTTENNINNSPISEAKEEVKSMNEDVKFSRAYLEANGVNVEMALESLGDMEMYNDTANDVYTEIYNKLNDLKKFLDAKDMTNYSVIAHALKSDARYVGFKRLGDIAYNHELASKNNDIPYITANFEMLSKEVEKVAGILKNYLGQ